MADNLYMMQGSAKVRMEDLPPEAWKVLVGQMGESDAQNLYANVAALFRAINARADAAASIPFRIENRRGRAIESSDDWKGGNGWLPNPRLFIRQAFMSMDFTNAVYAAKLLNKFKIPKGLQYFVPTTITPKFDDNGNILEFERKAGKIQKTFEPEELFYVWIQDAFTEVGASPNTPMRAAMAAAGVLRNLDDFVKSYFEGGAIDPVIAAIPRSTPQDERDRMESWLNRALTGIKNIGKIRLMSSEDVKLTQPLRNGLDSLKKTELTKDKREDIGLALGIPMTFMLSDQANYATATQNEKTLIRWGVQPRLEQLYDALDAQLYQPMGVHLRPDFDSLEMFQEEEVNKMQAASTLIDLAGKAKDKAQLQAVFTIMGIDATEEQIEQLMPEVEDVEEPESAQPQGVQEVDDDMEDETADAQQSNMRAIIEIGRWEKKSRNAGKLVTWHTVEIPENIRRHIMDAQDWRKGMSEARAMMRFGEYGAGVVSSMNQGANDIKALADAINKMANTEPQKRDDMVTIKADNVTVHNDDAVKAMSAMTKALEEMRASQSVIVNVPQQPTPSVTVEVPQQPAPVVNITNEVQTPEVKVEVKPADVLIPKPAKKMRIIRDGRGDITGAEAE